MILSLPLQYCESSVSARKKTLIQKNNQTSSRGRPQDLLKDVFKTFSCKSKRPPEARLSIYVLNYITTITRHTNCINLNKLNTLKHRHNAEIVKTWFSMKFHTKKYFLQESKYFLASEFRMQQRYQAYYSRSLKNVSENVVITRKL